MSSRLGWEPARAASDAKGWQEEEGSEEILDIVTESGPVGPSPAMAGAAAGSQ